MIKHLRPIVIILGVMTFLVGFVYPSLLWVTGQSLFPYESNGSLIYNYNHQAIGAEHLSQSFHEDIYFWGRPNAHDPLTSGMLISGARNLNPSHPELLSAVRKRIEFLRATHKDQENKPIPTDLVLSSASGLDPHITPKSAYYQASRIARARHISVEAVNDLIKQHTIGSVLGFIGEPRINVLLLNLALRNLNGNTYDR